MMYDFHPRKKKHWVYYDVVTFILDCYVQVGWTI